MKCAVCDKTRPFHRRGCPDRIRWFASDRKISWQQYHAGRDDRAMGKPKPLRSNPSRRCGWEVENNRRTRL